MCTEQLWFNLQTSLNAKICDNPQPQTSSKKNSPGKSETSQLGDIFFCVWGCLSHPLVKLFLPFYPALKPGSESFLSLWKPSVRIFNTWPHQNANHIRGTEREGWWREGEAEMGETGRWERDRERGQQTTTSNPTPNIRKMDERGGRLQFIPSSTHFSFFPASLPFIHFLAPKMFIFSSFLRHLLSFIFPARLYSPFVWFLSHLKSHYSDFLYINPSPPL